MSSAISSDSDPASDESAAILAFVTALHDHEQLLAAMFASGNRLNVAASAAQAALVSKLGYLGGHQVIAALATSQAHLGQAMSATAEGHRKLSRIGEAIGYRLDDSYGDGQKDPKSAMAVLGSLLADRGGSGH